MWQLVLYKWMKSDEREAIHHKPNQSITIPSESAINENTNIILNISRPSVCLSVFSTISDTQMIWNHLTKLSCVYRHILYFWWLADYGRNCLFHPPCFFFLFWNQCFELWCDLILIKFFHRNPVRQTDRQTNTVSGLPELLSGDYKSSTQYNTIPNVCRPKPQI